MGRWSAARACATRADWAPDASAVRANINPLNRTAVAPVQRHGPVVDVETVCAASVPAAQAILEKFGVRSVNVMTSAALALKDNCAQVMVSVSVAHVTVALDGPVRAVTAPPGLTPAWAVEA